MMSLGERRTPGTNLSNNEQYLSDHPISNLTQSNWRRPKDALPSLEGSNLNRTGVLLPDINNMGGGLAGGLGGASYKFDAGPARGGRPQENIDTGPKFKYKATGGAGFNSSTAGNAGAPASGQVPGKPRTTRRALGVLNNNQNQNVFSGSGFDQKMSMAINANDLHSSGFPGQGTGSAS